MKVCPYCKGSVPDDASKCMHCAEWLSAKPSNFNSDSLGRAANKFITFYIIWGIIVLIVVTVFFFAFFLPEWRRFPRW